MCRRFDALGGRRERSRLSRSQGGDYVVPKFTFHEGTTLENVKLHYYTIGDPANEPVVVLHGTGGSGKSHDESELRRSPVRARHSRSTPSRTT